MTPSETRTWEDRLVDEVLPAFGLRPRRWSPLGQGNINWTVRVRCDDADWVVQRLNPIFAPEVNLDIDAVTSHLARKGRLTPRLKTTRDGARWWIDRSGDVWRVLSYVEGTVHSAFTDARMAGEAGRMLGDLHRALAGLDHVFVARRLGVHDTPRHMTSLQQALKDHPKHPAYDAVAPLSEAVLGQYHDLKLPTRTGEIVAHGDPKASNLIFSPRGDGRCWIDLDTVGPMLRWCELGDALRSWCSTGPEDAEHTAWDLRYAEAALTGYRKSAAATTGALADGVRGTEVITLELAARFGADALNERYFAWDPKKYVSASQHHLQRARSMLTLAQSVRRQRDAALAFVEQLGCGSRSHAQG